MNFFSAWFAVLLGSTLLCQAADVVVLKNGERRVCRIAGVEGENLLLVSQPVADLPPFVLSFPRKQTASLEFGPDPQREKWLREASKLQITELRSLWEKFAPLLPVASSPGGRIGLRFGLALLEEGRLPSSAEALSVFSRVAHEATDAREHEAGIQGRLRAWTMLGLSAEAVAEAEALLKADIGACLAAEARLVLAAANEAALIHLLEENPRWEEDDNVRPERNALYHKTLDLFLQAALLPGGSPELAMRGLWGALGIHRRCGQLSLAAETARDLIAFFPGSAFATKATLFLEGLPSEIREPDPTWPAPASLDLTQTRKSPNPNEKKVHSDSHKDSDLPAAAPKRRKRSRD